MSSAVSQNFDMVSKSPQNLFINKSITVERLQELSNWCKMKKKKIPTVSG